jgi:transcriptional regulator of acetoin/glycerol metabolism
LPKALLTAPQEPSAPPTQNVPENGWGLQDAPAKTTTFPGATSGGWGEVEKGMILETLTKTLGNRSKAADLLGWSRSKLWRKIKHHGLE